jgi:hypothetical protein
VSSAITEVQSIFKSALSGLRYARAEYLFERRLRKPKSLQHWKLNFCVKGDYFITSDDGVFRLRRDTIRKVCDVPSFGIGLSDAFVYLAAWNASHSIILRGNRLALTEEGVPYEFTRIYQIPISNSGSRVHQVCVARNHLWITNTSRNSLTKLDCQSGAWLAEIAPITCSFGSPITVDHNHVNSVTVLDNVILFVAFRIGRQSLIGICGKGLVRGYAYRNMGVHDIHIVGQDFVISDSYRFNEGEQGGILVVNWKPFDPSFFVSNPQFFIRGVAGCSDEMIIGSSNVGNRQDRFKGRGRLLLANGQSITHLGSFPSAQIYDVIRTDGKRFDTPPQIQDFGAICQVLEQNLGAPVFEIPLQDALVSENGKKYDERDRGDVCELQ